MSTATVREANVYDVLSLAPRLRKIDIEECRAVYGNKPHGDALLLSLMHSHKTWAVVDETGCVGLFGVAKFDAETGCPWFVCSDEMFKHRTAFARQSRAYVKEMSLLYPKLINFVSADNAEALNWLRWCGFEFSKETLIQEFGFDKKPYYRFTKVRSIELHKDTT